MISAPRKRNAATEITVPPFLISTLKPAQREAKHIRTCKTVSEYPSSRACTHQSVLQYAPSYIWNAWTASKHASSSAWSFQIDWKHISSSAWTAWTASKRTSSPLEIVKPTQNTPQVQRGLPKRFQITFQILFELPAQLKNTPLKPLRKTR